MHDSFNDCNLSPHVDQNMNQISLNIVTGTDCFIFEAVFSELGKGLGKIR